MNRKHRSVASLTAVVVLLGLVFGVGSPAAAATTGDGTGQACKYDYLTYNACLSIYSNYDYTYSVTVGIDLHLPANRARADLRRGSTLRATLHTTANGPGIVLEVRSGWPQAGPYVLSAQFGADHVLLERVPGDNAFQAEIVFTEVNADGSTTIRTYKTGTLYDTAA